MTTPIKKLDDEEVKRILMFISSMQKTGSNIVTALGFYGEKIAKNQNVKSAINKTVAQLSQGTKLEEVLKNNGFLNDFQYAILKIAKNKQKAIENIIELNKDRNEATSFYFKQFSRVIAIYVGILLFLPYGNDFFLGILNSLNQGKPKPMIGIIDAVIHNNHLYHPMAFFLIVVYIFGVFFYKYTYANSLDLHYKVFKYRAMLDVRNFLELMQDLMRSGLNSVGCISLLVKHIEPKSSRKFLESLQKSIENKNFDDFEKYLGMLGFNEFATFTLQSAMKTNDLPSGWKNALVNTVDYNEIEIKSYKEVIDLIVFALETLIIAFTMGYFMILETMIGFN